MDTQKIHIQFGKDGKYMGKVDPTHAIIAGHYNVEVTHDEHEDIEKNKDNADHIASVIGSKEKISKIEPIKEATYPLFGDADLDTVNQKIKKHGRNPDTVKQGETVHVFTHRGEHGFAQVHYDPSLDKYKVLGKSNVKKGVHAKYFDKDSDAHAHAKDWVKNPIHEMVDELMELSKQTLADYIKNASYDVLKKSSDKASAASKTTSGIYTGDKEREEEGSKEREEIHDKMLKRTSNINKAAGKLQMKESYSASILDSIINNKPIQAQEQFGIAMANVIKSKIDDMRQEISKDIFNKVNENLNPDSHPEIKPLGSKSSNLGTTDLQFHYDTKKYLVNHRNTGHVYKFDTIEKARDHMNAYHGKQLPGDDISDIFKDQLK